MQTIRIIKRIIRLLIKMLSPLKGFYQNVLETKLFRIVFFFLKLKKYSVDRNKIANLTYSYNIYAILSIDGHKLHEILFIQNLKLK